MVAGITITFSASLRFQPGHSRTSDVPARELRAQLGDELVHHALDALEAERLEGDRGVEAVAELGGEGPLDHAAPLAADAAALAEAHRRVAHLARAGVGGHDQDDVA